MTYLSQLTTAFQAMTGRLGKDERGVVGTEYLGIIVVIAVIIAALAMSDIGENLGNLINQAIQNVFDAA